MSLFERKKPQEQPKREIPLLDQETIERIYNWLGNKDLAYETYCNRWRTICAELAHRHNITEPEADEYLQESNYVLRLKHRMAQAKAVLDNAPMPYNKFYDKE